jgi:ribosome maturation factor RimP
MNSADEHIKQIVEDVVKESSFLLIDLIIRGHERNKVIEVFIDGEENLSAEDCAGVSRKINKIIEEKELLTSSYRFDVSSPGVEKPLKYLQQFPKHLNRRVELKYKSGDDIKTLTGKLLSIEGEYLLFLAGKELTINFNDIIKAKVLVSFN